MNVVLIALNLLKSFLSKYGGLILRVGFGWWLARNRMEKKGLEQENKALKRNAELEEEIANETPEERKKRILSLSRELLSK